MNEYNNELMNELINEWINEWLNQSGPCYIDNLLVACKLLPLATAACIPVTLHTQK